MNRPLALLALIGLMMVCPWSRAELVVEITKGQDDAIPIAIVPFNSPTEAAASFDVAQLVSDDLARSGRFKSMARTDMIEQPHMGANIAFDDWRRLNNDYIVVGQVQLLGPDRYNIVFEVYNVLNRQRLLGYQISANKAGLRLASHQVADMVFQKILGVRGAFATRVAYVSVLGHLPNKSYQLVVADADGMNPRVVMQSNEPLMSPAWSPDGSQIMFSSSMLGNPELFVVDANGSRPKRVTFSNAASTSPTWNPKTGQSVVFVSDRGGIPKLYLMNADGTNTSELALPDKGYLIDPAWSPNGQMVAFSWRRPDGNFDIYIMDPATREIRQITRDSGKNERPSWAPDGRHIVFESTRNGQRQIWTMLADGSQAHLLTMSGHNESPNWSPK